ncbi:acid phosphatase 1 [Nicotiana tabacum]|uniref:Acid phosphatase 1 n=2 Tax=Nicotiana TaxID=4085 RepID=A0A1S4BWP1_TOBAC|nr:PREDICTED: acid phosphatase 1-like [Nicotiana sylvestris]XP_016493273.1 PREDICTED: acid phosphatase 1-like [Nicotiana tabacum]
MAHVQNFLVAVFISFTFVSTSFSQSILGITPEILELLTINRHRKIPKDNNNALYCESWRFTVETNDAGLWALIPERCASFVQDYMNGDRYSSDCGAVADLSLAFANTVKVSNDGKDAWVFDIDETLLSNLPYYVTHGFGSEIFDEIAFDKWVNEAEAPAIPASLKLYKELQQRGFKIFLLTGRSEFQRNYTEKNLVYAGYSNWERLILRGPSDKGKLATQYKSEKRKELEDEGYRIHGSSGDQWSDLNGFAVATRSFKLPNPMYYIA